MSPRVALARPTDTMALLEEPTAAISGAHREDPAFGSRT